MGKQKENEDDVIELRCPYCDGTEIVEATQGGYGQITAVTSPWYACSVFHLVCRDCGTIIRSFVKDPEKLVKYKNRRKRITYTTYVKEMPGEED